MTGVSCAFAMIFSGYLLDAGLLFEIIKQPTWENLLFHARDLQAIGMMLLAFLVCPYKRTEIKVATFFLILWRVLVFFINCFDVGQGYTLFSLLLLSSVYLAWPLKAWLMGEYKQGKEQRGAFHIFFPVHSIWGLLQSVFLPWHPARYETRMVADGKYIWTIRHRTFRKYDIERLSSIETPYVKVYLGRDITAGERTRLDNLVGKKATPGISDCRQFLLK